MANKKPTKKAAPKKTAAKKGRGRPTVYKPDMADMAYRFALLGYTDSELARALGVSDTTVDLWKTIHPEFSGSISAGKEIADARVAESLFASCFDRTVVETQAVKVKVSRDEEEVQTVAVKKVLPTDYRSISLWLRNRQPKKWREKIETGFTDADGNDRALDPLIPSGKLTFEIVQHGDAQVKPATGQGADEQ
jgi:hypothetical protein